MTCFWYIKYRDIYTIWQSWLVTCHWLWYVILTHLLTKITRCLLKSMIVICNRNCQFCEMYTEYGAHIGAVGWGTVLQAGRSRVCFPVGSLEFLNLDNTLHMHEKFLSSRLYSETLRKHAEGRSVLHTLINHCSKTLRHWSWNKT
jgi:hypothetical protein